MAYMSQEKKKEIAALLKAAKINKSLKYSLAVRNHSTIVMNIYSGNIDFLESFNRISGRNDNYIDVNPYHYKRMFDGEALEILQKIFACLNDGNYDNSEPMVDYFDVGWYVDVKVGNWDRPYVYNG